MLLGSGRELASRFQKLGSHLLKVLHFVPTAFRDTTGFGEALSVRYRTPPLICRTAGKLCKCYAALGLNHRLTGPAHPRHDLLAVVFVAGHDLPAVTVSEREPSLISIQRRLFHFEGIIGGAALTRNRIRPDGRRLRLVWSICGKLVARLFGSFATVSANNGSSLLT